MAKIREQLPGIGKPGQIFGRSLAPAGQSINHTDLKRSRRSHRRGEEAALGRRRRIEGAIVRTVDSVQQGRGIPDGSRLREFNRKTPEKDAEVGAGGGPAP